MNNGKKSLEEVTEVLSKRGWRLYEDGQQKKTRSRTVYDKAVEDLEANMASISSTEAGGSEKPRNMLRQIINMQNHLDERFAAKKGGYAAVSYNTKQAFSAWGSLFTAGQKGSSVYKKADVQIIAEQRTLTKLLFEDMKKAKTEMGKSCGLLEEYRLETARDLHRQTRRYLRVEKELSKLEEDETLLNTQMASTTAESESYAELVHTTGNFKLERQKLVNDYENTAGAIRNSRTGIDEITDYQLVVQESEQILGDACNSLEQVSTQQAIAQAVLSAFAKGEASMNAAYQVMEALSNNIVATHRTITGAFESLNRLSTQLGTKKVGAGSTTEASKGLYGSLRGSRKGQTQDVHQYARQLFEKPMMDYAGIGGNGHNPGEAMQE